MESGGIGEASVGSEMMMCSRVPRSLLHSLQEHPLGQIRAKVGEQGEGGKSSSS